MLPLRIRGRCRMAANAAAAAGLLLGLETSCAPSSSAPAKNQAGATASGAGAGGASGQPSSINGSRAAGAGSGGGAAGATVAASQPAGRFVATAKVNDDAPTVATSPGGTPSLGQELLAHAIPAAGDNAPAARTSEGGGNGVPMASAERRVGVVRVIGAHGKFVLLETTTGYGGVPLNEGQELRCRGAAADGGVQTAVLKVSREREASYLVADVVSGEPQAGDVAYFPIKKEKADTVIDRSRRKDQ